MRWASRWPRRAAAASGGQRQALAQACEIEACDGVGPLSAWASALGGLGSVLGDGNASTLTYNFGGAAAGIDYRLDPRFLVGIGAGYTHGTQWVNSFMGQGWSDSVSVAAYGSFTQAGFYLDALAGYAYFNNQLQRQILIPGLQQRTATGSTGANQFLGQVEAGYKVGVYAPAAATITPFGRLQVSSVTQNAFTESGAQSLSLNVAQQTTNSLRTTIGADLRGSIGLGNERKLDLAVRLGWQHEFADTGRPITAAFAGAPGNSFTVFGATPRAMPPWSACRPPPPSPRRPQVYLRYDGEHRRRHRQPRAQRRPAHELVSSGASVRPTHGVRPTLRALPRPLCRYASIILLADDAWLLTVLSNVVAYACRHSRAEDRLMSAVRSTTPKSARRTSAPLRRPN